MNWTVIVARTAYKQLNKLPAKDRDRVVSALKEMEENPQTGNVKRIINYNIGFRRRVGNYRILFNLNPEKLLVEILSIEKRSDNTYRKR